MDDSEIGAHIKELRKARGLTLTDLQNASGINNGNLSKIERGLQSLTNDTIRALASALGVSPAELFADKRARSSITRHNSASGAGDHYRDVREYKETSLIPQDENVSIATIEVMPDAANGGVAFGHSRRQSHVFHGGSIAQIPAKPDSLVCLEIEDDMMAPRLHQSDVVVIDLDDTAIPPSGGVFACVLDGERVVVRRLIPYINKGIRIICDNTKYPEITLTAQQAASISIAGRLKHLRSNAGF